MVNKPNSVKGGTIFCHVFPQDEEPVHFFAHGCSCDPEVNKHDYGFCVVHNSRDGREALEEAVDILGIEYKRDGRGWKRQFVHIDTNGNTTFLTDQEFELWQIRNQLH